MSTLAEIEAIETGNGRRQHNWMTGLGMVHYCHCCEYSTEGIEELRRHEFWHIKYGRKGMIEGIKLTPEQIQEVWAPIKGQSIDCHDCSRLVADSATMKCKAHYEARLARVRVVVGKWDREASDPDNPMSCRVCMRGFAKELEAVLAETEQPTLGGEDAI